jgi:hypothetical protein
MKFFPRTDAEGTRRLFWIVLFATGVFKLGTAIVLPLTGDEAYFVTWGRNPALGYYDHGAMTGWWLAAMLWFGDAEVWLRLPAVAMSLFVGVIVRSVLRPVDPRVRVAGSASAWSIASRIAAAASTAGDTPWARPSQSSNMRVDSIIA